MTSPSGKPPNGPPHSLSAPRSRELLDSGAALEPAQQTKLLVLDRDNVHRGMLACMFPTRYALTFAQSEDVAIEQLAAHQHDVVLVGFDASTPRLHERLCRRAAAMPTASELVVVLIDERFIDGAHARAAVDAAGAAFALPFPFEVERFERRLEQYRRRQRTPSSHVGLPAVVVSTTARHGAARATEGREDPSGVTAEELPNTGETAPAAPRRSAEPFDPWLGFRRRIDQLWRQLESSDYYQMLRVPPHANGAAIKDAYFERSVELHPDRFVRLEDDQLKQRLYEIFKRISEGFKVLSAPESRAVYDEQLATTDGPRPVRLFDAAVPRADPAEVDLGEKARSASGKRYAHFAGLAEREGNLRAARMYLGLALQCEPGNDALRRQLDGVTTRLTARRAPIDAAT